MCATREVVGAGEKWRYRALYGVDVAGDAGASAGECGRILRALCVPTPRFGGGVRT
jgi:hypothetical protein